MNGSSKSFGVCDWWTTDVWQVLVHSCEAYVPDNQFQKPFCDFWIFFNETRHICKWAWKNNNLKISLKSPRKLTVILSKICIMANLRYRKKWFYTTMTTKLFIAAKCQNFSLPNKLDWRKTKHFCDRCNFCSTFPNICDRTKRIWYGYSVFVHSASCVWLWLAPLWPSDLGQNWNPGTRVIPQLFTCDPKGSFRCMNHHTPLGLWETSQTPLVNMWR
jgi:hypothetical protein